MIYIFWWVFPEKILLANVLIFFEPVGFFLTQIVASEIATASFFFLLMQKQSFLFFLKQQVSTQFKTTCCKP